MRAFCRALSVLTLLVGLALCLLGILAFPDGGLMFALPYVFLQPGFVLSIMGGLGLCFTRSKIQSKI
jgi:hypothetical protein